MNRIAVGMVALGLLTSAGCAYNSNVGKQGTTGGQYFGTFGVTGYGGTYVLKSGSKLQHISIIGDNNVITVQDDVTLPKIEFWGSGNTVYLPEGLEVRVTEVGNNNRLIRQPRREPYSIEMTPLTLPAPVGNENLNESGTGPGTGGDTTEPPRN